MKKYLNKILYGVSALLGVIAIIMLAAPAIVPKGEYADYVGGSFSGANVAFGNDNYFAFSFGYFLPYLLVAIGVAFVIVAVFGKLGKIAPIVAAVCFVVAGIMFFLPIDLMAGKDINADELAEFKNYVKEICTVGAGAIMAGIFSLVAAVLSVVTAFVVKTENN